MPGLDVTERANGDEREFDRVTEKGMESLNPIRIHLSAITRSPERQRRLVMAWAEIHQFELLTDWDLLQDGKAPVKIEPLR